MNHVNKVHDEIKIGSSYSLPLLKKPVTNIKSIVLSHCLSFDWSSFNYVLSSAASALIDYLMEKSWRQAANLCANRLCLLCLSGLNCTLLLESECSSLLQTPTDESSCLCPVLSKACCLPMLSVPCLMYRSVVCVNSASTFHGVTVFWMSVKSDFHTVDMESVCLKCSSALCLNVGLHLWWMFLLTWTFTFIQQLLKTAFL